jgi:hypothetical protein
VTASVADESGALRASIFSEQRQSARRIAFEWAPDALEDGRYVLTVLARSADGRTESLSTPLVLDRVLGAVAAQPASFSPNGDGVDDATSFSFSLTRPADVVVDVRQGGAPLAVLLQARLEPGHHAVQFDGLVNGVPLAPGFYEVVVSADDGIAQVAQPAAFEVVAPPAH